MRDQRGRGQRLGDWLEVSAVLQFIFCECGGSRYEPWLLTANSEIEGIMGLFTGSHCTQ